MKQGQRKEDLERKYKIRGRKVEWLRERKKLGIEVKREEKGGTQLVIYLKKKV